jgi:hypothetical protein
MSIQFTLPPDPVTFDGFDLFFLEGQLGFQQLELQPHGRSSSLRRKSRSWKANR